MKSSRYSQEVHCTVKIVTNNCQQDTSQPSLFKVTISTDKWWLIHVIITVTCFICLTYQLYMNKHACQHKLINYDKELVTSSNSYSRELVISSFHMSLHCRASSRSPNRYGTVTPLIVDDKKETNWIKINVILLKIY